MPQTKAQAIMALHETGLNPREIADQVGCLTAYVRVVVRQRKGKGQSEADRKYSRKLSRLAQTFGDRDAAREAGSKARQVCDGDAYERRKRYAVAYNSALIRTARAAVHDTG